MDKAKIITSSILVVYFLFTSGFIFEVSKSNNGDRIDIPYSVGLSAERTGIGNITTQDDLNCMKFLEMEYDGMPMIGDYYAYLMIQSYVPQNYFDTYNLRRGDLTHIPDDCWIFISTWNTEHKSFIEPTGIGTRKAYPLPEIKQPTAYRSGNSIVYKKQTPKLPEP